MEWLLFLHDNHFGGILCDEMGLGKTHQALGFITAIREQRNAKNPVLVVCPATVTGHWQVVIHYDRWWNAAREDQATDRVHRIGQVNGVQVVKFIVRNSVEERIHGIIERKALLAQENLLADVPDKNKMFTREELLDLLTV